MFNDSTCAYTVLYCDVLGYTRYVHCDIHLLTSLFVNLWICRFISLVDSLFTHILIFLIIIHAFVHWFILILSHLHFFLIYFSRILYQSLFGFIWNLPWKKVVDYWNGLYGLVKCGFTNIRIGTDLVIK